MLPALPGQFSSVFSLTGDGLDQIPDDNSRKKRQHRKSRDGCVNCKRRRVKCDEGLPSCSNCVKRRETCHRPAHSHVLQRSSTSSSVQARMTQQILGEASTVNLLHMKLFHHFQSSTQRTLAFPPRIWNEALKLSFDCEFLMHAILSVSARHLAFLSLHEGNYTIAARTHLSQALRLFREVLCRPLIDTNLDAILCTSVLLYYEAWCNVDFLPADDMAGTTSYDASKDQLFTLSGGMLHIFFSALSLTLRKPSIFLTQTAYRSMQPIQDAVFALRRDPSVYESFLAECYGNPEQLKQRELPPLHKPRNLSHPYNFGLNYMQTKFDRTDDPHKAYLNVVAPLGLLLALAPKGAEQSEESVIESHPELLHDVSRTFYTFPLLCQQPFIRMLAEGDLRGLVPMYHFYRVLNLVLPKKECWWASRRAEVMEKSLRQRLWG